MRITRLLFEIPLLALVAFCLLRCGQGIVQECSDDLECSEEPNRFCDLSVHRCIARPCTPDCSGRECGPDPQNCGTSCGTCKLPDQHCDLTTGRCEPSSNATLLWDGSFHGDEHKPSGQNAFVDDSGVYKNGCLRSDQPAFELVDAAKIGSGKTGWAGKFYNAAGTAGNCNSNNHNQIVSSVKFNPSTLPNHEIWYGWSQFQSGTWNPRGSGGTDCGTNPEECMVYTVGLSPNVDPFNGVQCPTDYPNCVYTGKGGGSFQSLQSISGASPEWVLKYGNNYYDNAPNGDLTNQWVDILVNMKMEATGGTGFTKFYISVNGGAYTLMGSKTEVDNVVVQPDRTYETSEYLFRVGTYMAQTIKIPITLIILNPKAATTCDKARPSSVACPGSSIPTPTSAPTPVLRPR